MLHRAPLGPPGLNVSDPETMPTCVIEATFVRPHLDRLTRDVNAAHSQLRDQGTVVEKLLLWRDESSRRIAMLEQSAVEQREENRRVDRTVGEVKAEVESLRDHVNAEFKSVRDRLDGVGNGVSALIHRFDIHSGEMKEAQDAATRRHEKILRVGMTVASSFAAVAVVLVALHGALSGVPLAETIKALFSQ